MIIFILLSGRRNVRYPPSPSPQNTSFESAIEMLFLHSFEVELIVLFLKVFSCEKNRKNKYQNSAFFNIHQKEKKVNRQERLSRIVPSERFA